MPATMSRHARQTYRSIFQHPVTHDLEWKRVIALFEEIGDLELEPNGKFKFHRNGRTLTFEATDKKLDVDEITWIRHFLEGTSAQDVR